MEMNTQPSVAVLIPCYNEAATIGKVVDDFRRELPEASVYVFDNCSSDETAAIAAEHEAIVIKEPRRGKGFVVDGMFDRVQADAYVMVDGDDTYPAEDVHALLKPVLDGNADMTVGARLDSHAETAFRPMHMFGNNLIRRLVNWLGHARLTDIMSGYRAFSRRVVERLPVVSGGFEVETEMTIQMLYYRMKIVEVPVHYRGRPAGSESKLRTLRDGSKVLWKIFTLFRSYKPLTFFGSVGVLFFICGILAGIPPIHDYVTTGKVPHFPLAILATGLMIISAGSVFAGILLHSLNWRLMEMHSVMSRKLKGR